MSCMSFASVPLQFKAVELHVMDALGQQDVPEYFQQPAKAIMENVSVMRGPQAEVCIKKVLKIVCVKKLGVYEETFKAATSNPLPARLISVTEPNVHGSPARNKLAQKCCNFDDFLS